MNRRVKKVLFLKEICIMKLLISMLIILFLFTGCLTVEKVEVVFNITPSGGEYWARHTGWKSSESGPEKIEKEFKKLIKRFGKKGEGLETELSIKGLYLLYKKMYVKNEKIITEYKGHMAIGTGFAAENFALVNNEIIHILRAGNDVDLDTNGKVYKTEKNTIITWPADTKKLTWTYTDPKITSAKNNLVALYNKWK